LSRNKVTGYASSCAEHSSTKEGVLSRHFSALPHGRLLQKLILTLLLAAVVVLYTAPVVAQTIPAPHYDLTVEASPAIVESGEQVRVTLNVLRNGEAGSLGLPIIRVDVETAPGVVQDASKPILLPAAPIEDRPGGSAGTVTYTFTAARSGAVTVFASINGEGYAEGPDGLPFYFFTSVAARSGTVSVLNSQDSLPVSIPEPVTIVLFGTGLAALAAAAAAWRKS
jgi:hypothetical protein